jgi:hypothetical protein
MLEEQKRAVMAGMVSGPSKSGELSFFQKVPWHLLCPTPATVVQQSCNSRAHVGVDGDGGEMGVL